MEKDTQYYEDLHMLLLIAQTRVDYKTKAKLLHHLNVKRNRNYSENYINEQYVKSMLIYGRYDGVLFPTDSLGRMDRRKNITGRNEGEFVNVLS